MRNFFFGVIIGIGLITGLYYYGMITLPQWVLVEEFSTQWLGDTAENTKHIETWTPDEITRELAIDQDVASVFALAEKEEAAWFAENPDAAAGREKKFAESCDVTEWTEECLLSACEDVTDISMEECLALVDLYMATNGDNWTNNNWWLENSAACSWYGVSCANGSVAIISLAQKNLVWYIPSSIWNLTNLKKLFLYKNSINGSIPASIWQLTALENLNLYQNQLGGYLPTTIGNLVNLTTLDLHKNNIGWPIPPSFSNLTNLTNLYLYTNQLCWKIPNSFRLAWPQQYIPNSQLYNNRLVKEWYNQQMQDWFATVNFQFGQQNSKYCYYLPSDPAPYPIEAEKL